MKTLSKRVRTRDKDIDFSKFYDLSEALKLLKERASAKFNETLEAIFVCALDPRKSDQTLRGMVTLPHGTGKTMRVAVFAKGDLIQKALDAGAHVAGDETLVEEVQAGRLDFDLCVATPDMMIHMSKLGKILGPKGLMPNPKLGTVTMDVVEAVKKAHQGQVILRPEKAGIVHASFGKMNFSIENLENNFQALKDMLLSLKPASIKVPLIKKVYVSSTMGFSLGIDLSKPLS